MFLKGSLETLLATAQLNIVLGQDTMKMGMDLEILSQVTGGEPLRPDVTVVAMWPSSMFYGLIPPFGTYRGTVEHEGQPIYLVEFDAMEIACGLSSIKTLQQMENELGLSEVELMDAAATINEMWVMFQKKTKEGARLDAAIGKGPTVEFKTSFSPN